MNSDRHSPIYRKIMASRAWRKARAIAMERHRHLCAMCEREGRIVPAVSVHHIVPVLQDPDRALEQSNLVALCDPCHREVEEYTRR